MKTYKCTDGFVEKIISANSAQEAAESYSMISSMVDIVEIDDADNEVGKTVTIIVEITQ